MVIKELALSGNSEGETLQLDVASVTAPPLRMIVKVKVLNAIAYLGHGCFNCGAMKHLA